MRNRIGPDEIDFRARGAKINFATPAGWDQQIQSNNIKSNNQKNNKNNIYETYSKLIEHGINNIPNPKKLDIIDIPLEKKIIPGIVNEYTGEASFKWLLNATNILLKGKANALVTAPISKIAWHGRH